MKTNEVKEYVVLNNGVKMPILAFGTDLIPNEDTKQAVLDAFAAGYRHIDTARLYGNENEVGEAVNATSVPRDEVFVTTKIWFNNYGYEKAKAAIDDALKRMNLDYLDLMLLHQPYNDYYGAYRALEEAYKAGKLRAIGVSNFYPDRLNDLIAFNEIKPQVDQIEIHPYFQQEFARANMESHGVQTESWATFARGKDGIFTNPILEEIGKKYNKSTAQIMIRWQLQRGIVCLAKSSSPKRMAQNLDVFDFNLTEEDMAAIKTIDRDTTVFMSHYDPRMLEELLTRAVEA
ncbi:putative oxidoreductase/MSMEI_2347 [Veillonella ratti]|uniref:Putative oxidoreductase/MSMEI_2347 n=5 Tax=Veillonellaceae TaxID=31977 RepID=A0A6N3EXK9_9FIRM